MERAADLSNQLVFVPTSLESCWGPLNRRLPLEHTLPFEDQMFCQVEKLGMLDMGYDARATNTGM